MVVVQSTALLVLGAYGVLLFIWFPLYVLSLAISTPGVYLLVFGVLYLAGRLLGETTGRYNAVMARI